MLMLAEIQPRSILNRVLHMSIESMLHCQNTRVAFANLQAKGREAVRASKIVPALTSLLRAESAPVQAGAAAALANLSCDPQSVRLIRRTSGIRPLVDLIGYIYCFLLSCVPFPSSCQTPYVTQSI